MRSVVIILGGLALLAVVALAGWRIGGNARIATAAQIFIPIWLATALTNMWAGVFRAGYPVADELPIFLAIFGVPAAIAIVMWWKFS
jgi:hypothetical protein